jgi:ABC-type transport system involved in multi-copper enzyme maturation permease subunit
MLTDGNSLIYGTAKAEDYFAALAVCAVIMVICLTASIPIFNKKQL